MPRKKKKWSKTERRAVIFAFLYAIALVIAFAASTSFKWYEMLDPTQDAWVREDQPSANFGGGMELGCSNAPGGQVETYLTFSLTADIYLKLDYGYWGGDLALDFPAALAQPGRYVIDVFLVAEVWEESTITWENRPALGERLGSLKVAINGIKWPQFKDIGYDIGTTPHEFSLCLRMSALSPDPEYVCASEESDTNMQLYCWEPPNYTSLIIVGAAGVLSVIAVGVMGIYKKNPEKVGAYLKKFAIAWGSSALGLLPVWFFILDRERYWLLIIIAGSFFAALITPLFKSKKQRKQTSPSKPPQNPIPSSPPETLPDP